uniref:Lipocalin AI-5 n=2 Tax=Triatominae TaxID=70999 RepID=Q7YT08_RHOPR|nr:lipocalin AI-5 precursor [Rhodnius prolixus]
MKTIILITIFGILMIRRIQCMQCDCESVEAAGNDGEFFKGNWQVTHSKIGAMFPICGKLETSSQDGKKIIKLDDEEVGTLEIKCTGSKESDCEVKKDNNKITGLFRVVSTDNSNYALVYICTKPASFPKDDYLILNKDKDAAVPAAVENKLKELKMESKDFIDKKDVCEDLKIPKIKIISL